MGQRNTDTAVLIFSLSAHREAERKSLFGNGKKRSTSKFFDLLIGRTKKLVATGGVDTFFIDERQQSGQSFGERYANAFQQLFDQGYSKVVSIGNDTPDLTTETLGRAIDEIQNNDLVVGPSTDGGIYLLGMDRSLFDTTEFLALPWLQDSLSDALADSRHWQQGGSFSLDILSDIDDTASLLNFAQSTSQVFLARFILRHLSFSKADFGHDKRILFSDVYTSSVSLRGPPSHRIYTKGAQKAA